VIISCYVSMKHVLLVLAFVPLATWTYGQQAERENTLRPKGLPPKFPSEKEVRAREKNAFKPKTTVDLQKEYYERVESVMKARKKTARLMQKPQYSDPSYFGHRRPPKKRSVKNMRFCKECGIRH
jgi:hypothetical protein